MPLAKIYNAFQEGFGLSEQMINCLDTFWAVRTYFELFRHILNCLDTFWAVQTHLDQTGFQMTMTQNLPDGPKSFRWQCYPTTGVCSGLWVETAWGLKLVVVGLFIKLIHSLVKGMMKLRNVVIIWVHCVQSRKKGISKLSNSFCHIFLSSSGADYGMMHLVHCCTPSLCW